MAYKDATLPTKQFTYTQAPFCLHHLHRPRTSLTEPPQLRSIVDHRKVFVLALNGPAIGAGAAWFTGPADILLASEDAYLQIPFSALGLIPENGSATILAQSLGVHRANDILMFGRQVSADEMEKAGLINRIFKKEGFHGAVLEYLQEQLKVNDGKSMMEMKRLQNAPLRDGRMIAVYNSIDALAERFVEDVSTYPVDLSTLPVP